MAYEVKVRPEKVEAVEEVKGALSDVPAVLLTEYRGLTVTELAELRDKLREAEASYRVVKNTLARRAADQLGYTELLELFTGPTAIAYCSGDAVGVAKVLAAFAKERPALVVKGGVLDGRVLSAEETQALATVDVLDVSRAKIMGQLTAGLSQIVNVLQGPMRQIAFVLQELGKREGEAGEQADAAAAPESESAPAAEAAPEAEGAAEAEAAPEEPEQQGEPEAATDGGDQAQEATPADNEEE